MLDDKMRQIRNAGKTIGAERIAVMAALNFSHELIVLQNEIKMLRESLQNQVKEIYWKVSRVLHLKITLNRFMIKGKMWRRAPKCYDLFGLLKW